MQKDQRILKCFVMSPGDVDSERRRVGTVFEVFNATVGRMLKLTLQPVRWEIEAERNLLGDVQGSIDKKLLEKADFGVAVFWERFGTEHTNGDSYSTHEVRLMRELGKPVILFHSKRKRQASATDIERGKQAVKLGVFLNEAKGWGLFNEYKTFDEFERLLQTQVFQQLGVITGDPELFVETPEEPKRDTASLDEQSNFDPSKDQKKLHAVAKALSAVEKPIVDREVLRLKENFGEVRILDVGCGFGFDTLAKFENYKGINVQAIDRSADAIAFAKSHNSVPHVSFEIADLSSIKVPKVEMIHVAGSLAFLPNKARLVQTLWTSIPKQGSLYIRESDDRLVLTEPASDATTNLIRWTQGIPGAPDRLMGGKLWRIINGLHPTPSSIVFHAVPFFHFSGGGTLAMDAFDVVHGLRQSFARQYQSGNKKSRLAASVAQEFLAMGAAERDHFYEATDLFVAEIKIAVVAIK